MFEDRSVSDRDAGFSAISGVLSVAALFIMGVLMMQVVVMQVQLGVVRDALQHGTAAASGEALGSAGSVCESTALGELAGLVNGSASVRCVASDAEIVAEADVTLSGWLGFGDHHSTVRVAGARWADESS